VAAEPDLEALLRRIVKRELGVDAAAIAELPGALGLRRFYRIALAGGPAATLVARVDRPEDPAGRPAAAAAEPPIEPIRALLAAHGLPVPARYGGDAEHGIELLEDVGDRTLADAARDAGTAERRALYHAACDLVPRLQSIAAPQPPVAAFGRRLDDALFAYKADLFATWALGSLHPGAGAAERAAVDAAFAAAARDAAAAPQRLAHRDLQSANIHVVPGRGLVLIDLQGAFLAPPEYDLVCLLRDSYVELAEAEVAHQCERIRPQLPDAPAPEIFARRFDLLTLTRKGKDLARFVYAAAERGDTRYLAHVPRTVAVLRAAADRTADRDPALRPFAELCHALREAPCAR